MNSFKRRQIMTKNLFIPANINATNSELDAKQIITHKKDNKEKSNNERSDYCEGEFIPNFHD